MKGAIQYCTMCTATEMRSLRKIHALHGAHGLLMCTAKQDEHKFNAFEIRRVRGKFERLVKDEMRVRTAKGFTFFFETSVNARNMLC